MGTCDVTCAVSHLPIQYGEPCRFIFLRQVMTWEGDLDPGDWRHAWAKWLPLSLPVQGLYDGYGRLMVNTKDHDSHHAEYDPDPLLKFQIESIARVAEPLPEEECKDYGDLDNFPNTIKSLMTACERGWLKVKLPRDRLQDNEEQTFQTVRVSPYYVSERAWQVLVAPVEEKGIGFWRKKLEPYHEQGILGGLRAMIDHYRDWPERRKRLKKIIERESEDSLETLASTLEALEQAFPLTLRGLEPHHEQSPDMMVIGGDWEPPLQERDSLYEFKDVDWEKFAKLAFDLKVFFSTLNYELRREMHPELYQDQFYYPSQGLEGHRILLRHIEKWCLDIEEQSKRDDGDD